MYVLGLAALFCLAAGVDRLVGPLFAPPAQQHSADSKGQATGHTSTHSPTATTTPAGPVSHGDHQLTPERGLPWIPRGLQIAEDGYAIRLTAAPERAGYEARLAFQITGPDGRPVTAYTPTHERPLHLIVIRRDLTDYTHTHPVMSADGTWSTSITLVRPGTYRVFADFVPLGRDEPLTLGTDLILPGNQEPASRLADSRVAEVSGYTARVQGDLKQGELGRLTFILTRNGEPVTDLEPYLGAYGHLIALRSGDLAYLHVHPAGTTTPGPAIAFDVEVPSTGMYRLFLDFQHRGTVRTAAFTLTARR